MGNIVAIVGRPNVGKSTFYNRMIGERRAIIDDISGVTRDRQYGSSYWNGKDFIMIDTGGLVQNSDDIFEVEIRNQVLLAIEEADVIVFMVDVTTGITDLDEQVTELLRKTNKTVVLAVNKVDNSQRMLEANEFWSLGFENVFFLSSLTGSGTGDLLDCVAENITEVEQLDTTIPKIAFVGQPNVGKSSMVNALLGVERNIVTDIAGTTRDSIHTKYNKFGKEFYIIDTAGIRKKSKVHENLEFYSVMRAIKALDEADVCVLMIDAQVGVESQDLSILKIAQKRNKAVVIVANKWDLVPKETNTMKDFTESIKQRISPFNDVPIIFTSALDKQRIFNVVEAALKVAENRVRKIKTSQLNDWLEEAIEKLNPPSYRGKFIKIKYVTQIKTYHPCFAFFCNYPQHVKEPYKNYLENQLRKKFEFEGSPITLYFRKK